MSRSAHAAIRLTLATALVAGLAHAQPAERFAARLGWVPVSNAELVHVSGSGTATATYARSRLTVTGAFEGVPGSVTRVSLRRGVATGAGGPAIADLDVGDGTFAGTVELDDDVAAALVAGHLYVQIHADGGLPPDGAVLRGWLLAVSPPAPR